MGKSRADVAWLGIQSVPKAPASMMPVANAYGDRSKGRRKSRAQRLLRPLSMSAPAMMKTPIRKKTAELPKAANASDVFIAPVTARSATARSPVMPNGMAFETHSPVQRMNTAHDVLPWTDSPAGAGAKKIARAIATLPQMIPYFAIVLNPNGRFSTTGSPPGGVGRGRSAGQRKALAAGSAFGSGLTGVVKNEETGDGRQETGVERNGQTYGSSFSGAVEILFLRCFPSPVSSPLHRFLETLDMRPGQSYASHLPPFVDVTMIVRPAGHQQIKAARQFQESERFHLRVAGIVNLQAVQARGGQGHDLVVTQCRTARVRGHRHAAGAVDLLDRFGGSDLHTLHVAPAAVENEFGREGVLDLRHDPGFHHRARDVRSPDVLAAGNGLDALPGNLVPQLVQPLDHEVRAAHAP